MSESKMVTEREAVLREREAFVKGSQFEDEAWRETLSVNHTSGADCIAASQRLYPLPKVGRPRVVTIDDRAWALREWRFVGGNLQSRRPGVDINGHEYAWTHVAQVTPTPAVVEALADLLANPTELVEDTP